MNLLPKRRWFQWSVRGLLLLFALVACGIGWFKYQGRLADRQQEIANKLSSDGWWVDTDDPFTGSKVREKIYDWFGKDYFCKVKSLRLGPGAEPEMQHFREYLAELTGLENLDGLSHQNLLAEDFRQFAKLPALRNVDLLSVKLPAGAMQELSSSRSIQELCLYHASVTDSDLAWIAKIKSLQELNLGDTSVSDAGVVQLVTLTNLLKLELGMTKVKGACLAKLGTLSQLRELDLLENDIDNEEFIHLSQFPLLERLDLRSTKLNDKGLQHLKHLKSLKWLLISETNITDAGLAHLSEMTTLDTLNLYGNDLHDAGLAHLKNLKSLTTLNLGKTQITDAGLVPLQGLTKLTFLGLNQQISPAALQQLKTFLPKCDIQIVTW